MTARSLSPTLSQTIWPQVSASRAPTLWLARNAALAVGFSLIIGLTAHAQFLIPGTPVPVTGQTFGVLLTGALLGPRLGVAAVLLYLLEGSLGLPVYSSAASVSSYGYLAGFVLSAGIVGWLAEQGWDRKPLTTALMMACGSLATYACGATWLSRFVGVHNALWYGVALFLVGDAVKAALAAALLPMGWRLLGARLKRDAG